MHLLMSSAKSRPFCVGPNVWNIPYLSITGELHKDGGEDADNYIWVTNNSIAT